MLKSKILLSLFSFAYLLLITSCSNKNSEVNKTVDSFFSNYKSNFRTADKNLISKELSDKIDSTIALEKYDAKRLKDLQSTDKPLMIEGDIFTSIYEGYTSYKIKSTDIKGDKANVVLSLDNKNYKFNWENEVVLIKENNSWKIDDVIYTDKKGAGAGTKDVLNKFLSLKTN